MAQVLQNVGIDHGPIDSGRGVFVNVLAGLGCIVNCDLIDRGRIDSCSDVVENVCTDRCSLDCGLSVFENVFAGHGCVANDVFTGHD